MRVLYIEDSESDADLTRRYLARHAAHVELEIADTFQAAMQRLAVCTVDEPIYDLVLTDVRLPDGDGLSVLAHIRTRQLPVAVVVLTGSGNEEMAVAALKTGADDYLAKRDNYLERLVSTLENTLRRFRTAITRHTLPLRVLYAEHHAADIDLTRRHLGRYAPHIHLEVVNTAPEVLQRLLYERKANYDLLMLDYRLPGMNALDLLKELEHADKLDMPTVLVTGQGDEEVAVQALRLGVADYLVKNPGYLYQLPRTLENTYNQALLQRERIALRESEQRYRTLFELAPVAIYTKDRQGVYTSANRLAIEAFGRSPLGLTDADLLEPGTAQAFHDYDRTVMEQRDVHTRQEYALVQGEKHVFLSRKMPLVDAQEQVIGVLGISLNITDQIRAEEAQRENEQRFRQLAEHIDQVFWLQDLATGTILYASPAYERIYGRPVEELYANPGLLSEVIIPEDRGHIQRLAQLIRQGRPGEAETRILRPDGSIIWVAGQIFPIFNKQGTLYRLAGLARDITEHRRDKEHLQQQERLVAVGQMAAGIAHDFNNILAIIMLYTQMLQLSVQSPVQQRHLNTIYQQSLHAANLVQQILDFSRRSTIERVAMEMQPFLKELVKLCRRTLPENIKIELECSPAPLVVSADPARLQQALMNMVINARDAMPDGGTLQLRLEETNIEPLAHPLPEMKPGKWLRLQLRDTGTGVPAEVLTHIFDPFFTTKPPGRGTGLGLAQVYGIVRQLEGQVTVESTVGTGTCFTIYLPVLEEQVKQAEAADEMPPRGAGETVLLVEDEAALRSAMAEMLLSLGYHVVSAEQGRQAEMLYREVQDDVSLVISDLVMPEMGGLELYQQLQEQYAGERTIRMLLVTGYPLEDVEKLRQEHNLSHWLQKPFTVDSLARAVAAALREE